MTEVAAGELGEFADGGGVLAGDEQVRLGGAEWLARQRPDRVGDVIHRDDIDRRPVPPGEHAVHATIGTTVWHAHLRLPIAPTTPGGRSGRLGRMSCSLIL